MGKISSQRRLVTTKLFMVDFSKILPSNLDCLWVDQTFVGLALGNNEKIVHLWAKRLHLQGGRGITMISALHTAIWNYWQQRGTHGGPYRGPSPITTLAAGQVGRRGETGGEGGRAQLVKE